VQEFKDDEDVGLVLKTNLAKNCSVDREICDGKIKQILGEHTDKKCKVYLLHGDMTDEEMHSLLTHPKISAALSLTHGEGFGLPLFEAAYMGVPVVVPGWSGHLDFLCDEKGKEHFYNVSYDLQPIQDHVVWDGVLIKESMWAYARERSAKETMRRCIDDVKNNACQAAAKEYASELKNRFSEEKMYKEFIEAMGINEEEFNIESWLDNLDIEEID
jgi:glycosyltransferase involved in cell wall biosynthesis